MPVAFATVVNPSQSSAKAASAPRRFSGSAQSFRFDGQRNTGKVVETLRRLSGVGAPTGHTQTKNIERLRSYGERKRGKTADTSFPGAAGHREVTRQHRFDGQRTMGKVLAAHREAHAFMFEGEQKMRKTDARLNSDTRWPADAHVRPAAE